MSNIKQESCIREKALRLADEMMLNLLDPDEKFAQQAAGSPQRLSNQMALLRQAAEDWHRLHAICDATHYVHSPNLVLIELSQRCRNSIQLMHSYPSKQKCPAFDKRSEIMEQSIQDLLRKQLERLAEKASETDDLGDLMLLSSAMVSLAEALDQD